MQHFVGNLPRDSDMILLSGLCLEKGKNITRVRSESSCVLGSFFCGFKILHQVRCFGNQWPYNSSDLNRNPDTRLVSRLYTMIYILDKVLQS